MQLIHITRLDRGRGGSMAYKFWCCLREGNYWHLNRWSKRLATECCNSFKESSKNRRQRRHSNSMGNGDKGSRWGRKKVPPNSIQGKDTNHVTCHYGEGWHSLGFGGCGGYICNRNTVVLGPTIISPKSCCIKSPGILWSKVVTVIEIVILVILFILVIREIFVILNVAVIETRTSTRARWSQHLQLGYTSGHRVSFRWATLLLVDFSITFAAKAPQETFEMQNNLLLNINNLTN